MRLTLRTLLAYLDDILDPADKEQLALKIESSEFAEDLVHRTRDTVRRLRLSAPQVIGSGMGLDPNTVAEYLDNVLPPESVGDFERICLESDMHLAEAAACHHVLTMVLGEPADVDPIMRQRMYSIPGESETRKRVRVEAAHVAVAAAPVTAPPMQVVASPSVVLPPPDGEGVPEYLRTSVWTGTRGAVLGFASIVLVGTVVVLFGGWRGWFGNGNDSQMLTADATTAPALDAAMPEESAAVAPAESDLTEGANSFAPVDVPPVTGSLPERLSQQQTAASDVTGEAGAAAPLTTEQDATSPDVPGDEPLLPPNSAAIPPQDNASDQMPPETLVDSSQSESTEVVGPPIQQQPAAVIPSEPVTGIDPADAAADLAAGDVAPAPGEAMVDEAAADNTQPSDETTVVEEVPAGPAELGTYLGGKTVLLRYDETAGAWFRVQPRSAVTAGERLLSLPEFRPKITLASGVHLDVSGGTQVVMRTADELASEGLAAAAAHEPGVELIYGRLILINTSGDEQSLRLAFGPSIAAVRLARNATLAIEVERKYVPGNDPRKTTAPVIIRAYAPDGGVVWQDAAGEKSIDNASRWTVSEGVTSDVLADTSPPDWIDQEPVGQLSEQRYGAPVVETTLVSDKPADIQLIELFQGNARKEVKSLAAKSSIHVGVFEPFIDALRDSEQKSNWTTHIATLRSAMALSPESATKVWDALVEQRDRQAAADLYEMLCGYNQEQVGQTPEQLKAGALVRLIGWLEKDSLDYRVLAVNNLAEITGKRLMRDPAANLKERTQNIRQWRNRLDEGELQPVRQR